MAEQGACGKGSWGFPCVSFGSKGDMGQTYPQWGSTCPLKFLEQPLPFLISMLPQLG